MKSSLMSLILFVFAFSIYAAPVWDTPTCIREGVDINWIGGSAEIGNNIVYTWSDMHSGTRNIYAQQFSKQGIAVWTEPILVNSSVGLHESPIIAKEGYANSVISWIDYTTNNKGDLYATCVDQFGNILWATPKLICSGDFYKRNAKLVTGNNGSVYIIWEDLRNGNSDIYGQCLNNQGVAQWTANGKQLTFMPFSEYNVIIVNDTYAGFMLGYNYQNGSHNYAFLCHFSSTGEMSWDVTYQILPGSNSVRLTSMIPFLNNSFVYSWSYDDGGTKIGVQRIDRSGNEYWDTHTVPSLSISGKHVQNPACAAILNSQLEVAWETVDDITDMKSFTIQNIQADGTFDYNPIDIPVSTPNSYNQNYKFLSDLNGGVYIIWQEESSFFFQPFGIKAQHIGADGSLMFGNPVVVTNFSTYKSPMNISVTNNSLSISWFDQRGENTGIYTQLYTVLGTPLLDLDGKSIVAGINSIVNNNSIKMVHRSNDIFVTWADMRYRDLTYLYYQSINEDGFSQFEPNGRQLTPISEVSYAYQFAICLGNNDEIAIAWVVENNYSYSIMGQLIDADGNKLWGDNGIMLSGIESVSLIDLQMSFEEGAFYLSWMKYLDKEDPNCVVCGQKIVNGQIEWGDNGVFISNPGIDMNNNTGPVISGRYYAWEQQEGNSIIFVQLLTPEGIPADGWPDYGKRVNDYIGDYLMQFDPVINSNDEGVFISWLDERDGSTNELYAEFISSSGLLMWDPIGTLISDQHIRTHKQLLGDNDILYLWQIGDTNSSIFSSAFSFTGNNVWQNLPAFIFENSWTCTEFEGCSFNNGGHMIVAKQDNSIASQLKYIYLGQDGNPIGSLLGSIISNSIRYTSDPILTSTQNNAYLAWTEYSDSHIFNYENTYEDMSGLYLQKLSNETVDNNDPTTPTISFDLQQNYPNPFNPETTIKYSLASQSIVKLDIYNIKGQKVRTLVNEKQAQGNFSVKWNGKDDSDKQVASGVYFYSLETGNKSITKKMVLLK